METAMNFTRFVYDAAPELPTFLLFVLLLLAWHIQREAAKPGSYWATVFQDESNRVSSMRLCCLWAFAVSSAVLLYITLNYVKTWEGLKGLEFFYVCYLVTWSASPVLAKFIEALSARWAK